VERATLARRAGRPADAVAVDDTLARHCPQFDVLRGTIAARADSLLAIGRRDEARALLARLVAGLDSELQAALLVRAAELAREDGLLDDARAALDRALGLRIGPLTRMAVEARIVRLGAAVNVDRALASLETLATMAPTPAARFDAIAIAAETLADSGRFEEALAHLVVPAATTLPDLLSAHRDAILARWLAQLAAAGEDVGIVAVYARHRTTIDTRASTTTIRQVASALGHLGLAKPALRALRMRDGGDDPHHAIAIAEAALDAGVVDLARETLETVRARAGSEADLAPDLDRISARLAAAQGHPDRVAVGEGVALAPVLARDLARAWMARGDVEVARGDWIAAADAYQRAQALAPDGQTALAATARLVEASAATQASGGPALARLAEIDDAVVRRATTLVTATREAGGFATPPSQVDAPRDR